MHVYINIHIYGRGEAPHRFTLVNPYIHIQKITKIYSLGVYSGLATVNFFICNEIKVCPP